MQVYSEKDSYVKADLCVGFGFDNNEICASRSIKPFWHFWEIPVNSGLEILVI